MMPPQPPVAEGRRRLSGRHLEVVEVRRQHRAHPAGPDDAHQLRLRQHLDVVYHHVQGLTTGVESFADELRRAGHAVHTPDLFDGRTFATIEEGMAHARDVGFGALLERGVAAAEGLSQGGVVYAGFSSGVMPAQQLAQTDADARGALLFHACLPVSEFGDRWPDGVRVQVHGMDADPFFAEEGGDLDAARDLVASADQAELFLYPGSKHLFTDSSLPSYDPAATQLLLERVLTFLEDL